MGPKALQSKINQIQPSLLAAITEKMKLNLLPVSNIEKEMVSRPIYWIEKHIWPIVESIAKPIPTQNCFFSGNFK